MLKGLISLVLVVAVASALSATPGCTEKKVESRREVEIQTETILQQDTVVE
ncbi:MAG: hypothetical protein HQ546_05815 [Planctomycetes bacterium]|nr:hypothetical protein [Planctomycetota bacterium]